MGIRNRTYLNVYFLLVSLFLSFNPRPAISADSLVSAISGDLPSVQNSLFYGRANYRIPIEVPTGRGGLTPNVALVYNSSQRYGWVGVGWDLAMDSIQRSSKRSSDGYTEYYVDDYFAIEGSSTTELILRNDWGPNYYGSKIEGKFSKYYFNNATGGWEVTTKDGTKYYYGSSAASRQENNILGRVYKWCLDKVQDTNGNYIEITYYKDGGEIYLDKIFYTGSSIYSPDKSIVFHRQNIDNVVPTPTLYTNGSPVTTDLRLVTIEIKYNDQTAKAYKLNYEFNLGTSRHRLISFQQFGSDVQIGSNGLIINESVSSKLPPTLFTYTNGTDGFQEETWIVNTPNWRPSAYTWVGDFDGDGRTDIATRIGQSIYVLRSNGSSFTEEIWATNVVNWGSSDFTWVGDFDGDGRTDIATRVGQTIYVMLSTGSSFNQPVVWINNATNWGAGPRTWVGDYDGDGKADIATILTQSYGQHADIVHVYRSTGTSFEELPFGGVFDPAGLAWIGDFNGDSRTDMLTIALHSNNIWDIRVFPSNGAWLPYWKAGDSFSFWPVSSWSVSIGDFNGDRNSDIAITYSYPYGYGTNHEIDIFKYKSNGIELGDVWYQLNTYNGTPPCGWGNSYTRVGDFNGDGKADIMDTVGGTICVKKSDGRNFNETVWTTTAPNWGSSANTWIGDFNGDGKKDIATAVDGTIYVKKSNVFPVDLLETVTNPYGGITTIQYAPSTIFANTTPPNPSGPQPRRPVRENGDTAVRLNFPIPVVTSITNNDNNGNVSSTSFQYADGYYDIAKREFRGFGYVKQINPDSTTVEKWFNQDNVAKGLISHELIRDVAGNIYVERYNTIEEADIYLGSVFPLIRTTAHYLFDGTSYSKQSSYWYEYDSYGNITRRYNYGDVLVSGDERDDHAEYIYDTTNWIVSKPWHIYTNDSNATKKSESWFEYYTGNGKLKKITNWLDNGVNPVTFFEYDTDGNLWKITDPKGYVTRIDYDNVTKTYPTTVTNEQLGLSISYEYDYRYGKPRTIYDFNVNSTTYQYDYLGRLGKIIGPDDNTSPEGSQSLYYENFGFGTGYQRVAVHSTEVNGMPNYLWDEYYFDGFGRTVMTRSKGPDNKVIVEETGYDNVGRIVEKSWPYFQDPVTFEPLETVRWITYTYDPLGRLTSITNSDNTITLSSYLLGTTILTDANGHKKEEDRDTYGQLVEVREYTGIFPNFNLYATTKYHYDVLGNLESVTDAAGNVTSIGYDTLSRKISMIDPDMGYWSYSYDANGNIYTQTDSKNQMISFDYDALNRLLRMHYPSGPDVVYTYDENFSWNPKGQLTTITDDSGTKKYFYDKQGSTVKTVQTVDGVDYTTEASYDALGRTRSITYPDPGRETVSYTYDTGGNLYEVVGYATYLNYNALGQPGKVNFANGDNTVYQYYPWNNRLFSITTNDPSQGLQNISYVYDNIGNVTSVTNEYDPGRTEPLSYGEVIYDYTGPRPHAVKQVGPDLFTYDDNGNMVTGSGRTSTFDYENRVGTISYQGQMNTFIYDYEGSRVKKITSGGTTIYLGGLYECTASTCTKHIFDGQSRIASKRGTKIYFYHTDQLGSATVITDESGIKVKETAYDPFGETRYSWGSINLPYKFTDQEEDNETGLYNFGARYYEPKLGRFVSADRGVKSISDPQSLNRYSYARNNPMRFIDPTGLEYEDNDYYDMWFYNNDGWTSGWDFGRGYGIGYGGGPGWDFSDYGGDSGGSIGGAGGSFNASGSSDPGSITNSPGILAGFVGDIYSDYRMVTEPGFGDYRVGIFMKYGSTALLSALPGVGQVGRAVRASEINPLIVDSIRMFQPTGKYIPNAGGVLRSFAQKGDKIYYRVFSGSENIGKFLTAIPPRSSAFAREALALPPQNEATLIQKVLVPDGTVLQRSRALLGAYGRRGGAEQFQLLQHIPEIYFGPGIPLP